MESNNKVKESNGYGFLATKHNLKTMAESIIFIRGHGIKSVKELDEFIKKSADERQELQDNVKKIESEMTSLSSTIEQIHTVKKYRAIYKEYAKNTKDKTFYEKYKNQIMLYQKSLKELKKSYSKLPDTKDILEKLDKLEEKKNTLMQEYSSSKSTIDKLYRLKKNYEDYIRKKMER